MAQIDLDKVGAALSTLRNDPNGAVALGQFRTAMNSLVAAANPSLNHAESVFLFRVLMADLSIDHPGGVPNAGPVATAVQPMADTLKNIHGFMVGDNK